MSDPLHQPPTPSPVATLSVFSQEKTIGLIFPQRPKIKLPVHNNNRNGF